MNREIIFRGKSIDGAGWLYGDLMRYAGGAQIWHKTSDGTWNSIVDPATVGQYTGMNDKGGKRVFEGDIIRTKGYGKIRNGVCVNDFDIFYVTFAQQRFMLENSNRRFNLVDDGCGKIEVIGNVYDNPELLEGTT